MVPEKKIISVILFLVIVVVSMATIQKPYIKERNLKVLPKDISDEKLDSIMQTYNIALGVKCNFCHVAVKNVPDSLDYASDAEPMKENARKMMEMVISINKTYFNFDQSVRPEYLNTIHCKTCHRGEPFPPED
ncbi:MAG TPA: c-type cytochrome [Chitinophagaceae bacterium]|nr:c-type cytochrome [Chitinophagaceae bacterium]